MKKIVNRLRKPTPPFFKQVRNIGWAMVAVGTSVMAAPVAVPLIIGKIAGYITVAGTVMGAVSQAAVAENLE